MLRSSGNRSLPSKVGAAAWLALCLAALLTASASAQSPINPGLTADIRVGFAGRFRHGGWAPVTVDLGHVRGFEGTLEVAVPRSDLFTAVQTYCPAQSTHLALPRRDDPSVVDAAAAG